MPKTKKIPLRQCVICGEMKPKIKLIRVVKSPDGEIAVDETGKANGRGAYICKTGDCLMRIKKSRRMEKGFRGRVPDEVYDDLKARGESDINA